MDARAVSRLGRDCFISIRIWRPLSTNWAGRRGSRLSDSDGHFQLIAMTATIPELCLVILVGPSGCGKSTFARKHFKPTEVVSSDFCRGLVSNDENSQEATNDAFDVLKYIVGKRLARGLLTVIDATNVQSEARKPLIELAREHDVLPVTFVLKMPEQLCQERNRNRPD